MKKPKPSAPKISDMTLARARTKPSRGQRVSGNVVSIFAPAQHPKGIAPRRAMMAQDEGIQANIAWAQNTYSMAFNEGIVFLGYAFLSELAQRPEYRVISETIATEMTRKWIKVTSSGNVDKAERIKLINKELDRLKVREAFCESAEHDGFFGRSHIFLDFEDEYGGKELSTPIGTGEDSISAAKVSQKKPLKRIKNVEPVWVYPTDYNSDNPLRPDWYKPTAWFVQGTRVHSSRLLTFVGREVPDLLKPAYSFGGLSLSQIAKPYIDNWLRTRQSVADLISSFSVNVLSTNMADQMATQGNDLFNRVDLFNLLRDNRGTMVLDKDKEKWETVTTPLGTLDTLQAQSQEHMAAITRIPLVKLLGISPAGLNASSDGEIKVFYDYILSYQRKFFTDNLKRILGFVQLSLFGNVDPDIGFDYENLWSMSEKEEAEVRKTDAETDAILVNDVNAISPEEVRERVARSPRSLYSNINVAELPEPVIEEDDDTDEPEVIPETVEEED